MTSEVVQGAKTGDFDYNSGEIFLYISVNNQWIFTGQSTENTTEHVQLVSLHLVLMCT